jgi:hypothetical protein
MTAGAAQETPLPALADPFCQNGAIRDSSALSAVHQAVVIGNEFSAHLERQREQADICR